MYVPVYIVPQKITHKRFLRPNSVDKLCGRKKEVTLNEKENLEGVTKSNFMKVPLQFTR